MDFLLEGFKALTWQQVVMWAIGGILIYLAIKKDMEPALLLPMGFGAILVNLPLSPVIGSGANGEHLGIITSLFKVGIEASEAMPLLLFIGIGRGIEKGILQTAESYPLPIRYRVCYCLLPRQKGDLPHEQRILRDDLPHEIHRPLGAHAQHRSGEPHAALL